MVGLWWVLPHWSTLIVVRNLTPVKWPRIGRRPQEISGVQKSRTRESIEFWFETTASKTITMRNSWVKTTPISLPIPQNSSYTVPDSSPIFTHWLPSVCRRQFLLQVPPWSCPRSLRIAGLTHNMFKHWEPEKKGGLHLFFVAKIRRIFKMAAKKHVYIAKKTCQVRLLLGNPQNMQMNNTTKYNFQYAHDLPNVCYKLQNWLIIENRI